MRPQGGGFLTGIRIKAWGSKTGTAGNKTVKLMFGEVTLATLTVNTTNSWLIESEIFNKWDGTKEICTKVYDGNTLNPISTI